MSGEQLAVQIGVVAAMVGGGLGAIARWVGRFLDRLLDRTMAAADSQHVALREAIARVEAELAELRLELYTLQAHLGFVRPPPPGAVPPPPPGAVPPPPPAGSNR